MDAPAPVRNTEEPWTTTRLLRWMHEHFERQGIDAPRVCAEMLLARALGCDRMRLYMDPQRPASAEERALLRDFVRRVVAHEPVQFVVGEAWFFGRPFRVSPATLIPRPATERLVEEAITHLRAVHGASDDASEPSRVLDLCTGTGCIAISLLRTKGFSVAITASDFAPDALDLARENARRHGVEERLTLLQGDLYAALSPNHSKFHLIASNPPYVADSEWDDLEPNVRLHEPPLALRGGADGLDLVRRVVTEAPAYLEPGGLLLVEIGHAQRDAALDIAAETQGLTQAEVLPDHEGFNRVLRARAAVS